jgi:hypothetical protein
VYAGHAGLAILAKAARPRIPMALLVPVAFAPDWIEWMLQAFGLRDRALSHSLVSVGIGATVVALAYYLATRLRSEAVVVWLAYLSHWPADFLTGLKPTWPGGPTVGLFLYSRPMVDALLEISVILLCWIAYRRSLPAVARNRLLGLLVPAGLIAMHLAFLATTDPRLRK